MLVFESDDDRITVLHNREEVTMSLREVLDGGREGGGIAVNGNGFWYTVPRFGRTGEVTYYEHDHLGDLRVAYVVDSVCQMQEGDGAIIGLTGYRLEHVLDYYPYGKELRQYVNAGGQERYLTTQHERDQETGLDYRGARYYDSDVARFLSLDPLAADYASWSPYNYVMGNPISITDPTGASATEYDADGNKISDLGGDKIDFFHQKNGDTKVVDRASGASTMITGGESLIRGYSLRDGSVTPSQIGLEFYHGTGPEYSMFASFNGETTGPFGSLRSTFSTYTSKARAYMLGSEKPKDKLSFDYSETNPLTAGPDMWEQMFGRTGISWYKLGDQALYMMHDSKSSRSLYYHGDGVRNHSRSEFKTEGNTYQTYLWTESLSEAQRNAGIVRRQQQDRLENSPFKYAP